MDGKARKILKRQRDRQLLSIISVGAGLIFFLYAKRFESSVVGIMGVLLCVLGGAYIAALKAYDMGNKDGVSGEYNLIRDVKDADIEKEDYTD